MSFYEVTHPMAQEKLSILREKTTTNDMFARSLEELSLLIFIEATKNLATSKVKINTPFKEIESARVKNRITLVPIMRAGVGMIPLIRKFYQGCKIGFIGLKRDEHILKPTTYFINLPKKMENDDVFILDPMLATGGSIIKTIELLEGYNVKPKAVISIISAPEGIKAVKAKYPYIDIYTASVDEKLNENGFIVPGLGDAGDRLFGTEE